MRMRVRLEEGLVVVVEEEDVVDRGGPPYIL